MTPWGARKKLSQHNHIMTWHPIYYQFGAIFIVETYKYLLTYIHPITKNPLINVDALKIPRHPEFKNLS